MPPRPPLPVFPPGIILRTPPGAGPSPSPLLVRTLSSTTPPAAPPPREPPSASSNSNLLSSSAYRPPSASSNSNLLSSSAYRPPSSSSNSNLLSSSAYRPPSSSNSNLLSMHGNGNGHGHGSQKRNAAAPQPHRRPGEAAATMLNRITALQQRSRLETVERLRNAKDSGDYLRQMPRRWAIGDVYSPHDLSPVEMQKWRKRSLRKNDVVDALGLRPLDMYKNFSLVQEFTTSSGQIIHSAGTSLRPVNQRKIAKMIRRVQGMGIYPTVHDHPEMIRNDFFPPEKKGDGY